VRIFLVRVGIDQAFGGWNAPIDPESNEFVYVPIPEAAGTQFQPGMRESYGAFRNALRAFAAARSNLAPGTCETPGELGARCPHLDPDFAHLTYGDNGARRGKGMSELGLRDGIAFYAGLRPVRAWPQRLVYALIGFYRVDEVLRVAAVPRNRWTENAHTRRLDHSADDIVVRALPGESGRLRRALPIGEYRNGAYRVTDALLRAWDGLSCHDGFIQRSAVPPEFVAPERFMRWFEAQSPALLQANNPPTDGAIASSAARVSTSTVAADGEAPVVLVHLRQPRRTDPAESRTDPLYEFGSFGLTGCHGCNLLHDQRAEGARLGFVQPGPGEMRLVLLTPRVRVIDHGVRREATWSATEKPLRFEDGVVLIDQGGNSAVRGMRALLEHVARDSWVAKFSSKFRSRTRPLPPALARAVVAAWNGCVSTSGDPATQYWETMPEPPPRKDSNRRSTRQRLLDGARGSRPSTRRCR
jgi:hypothetical protein